METGLKSLSSRVFFCSALGSDLYPICGAEAGPWAVAWKQRGSAKQSRSRGLRLIGNSETPILDFRFVSICRPQKQPGAGRGRNRHTSSRPNQIQGKDYLQRGRRLPNSDLRAFRTRKSILTSLQIESKSK